MGILVYSKCLSSNCQERCSTSEVNNFGSVAPSTTACELLTTSKALQPPNWNLGSTTSCLSGWTAFKTKLQICWYILLPSSTHDLERQKGWRLRECITKCYGSSSRCCVPQKLQRSLVLHSKPRCWSTSTTSDVQLRTSPTKRMLHSKIPKQWSLVPD